MIPTTNINPTKQVSALAYACLRREARLVPREWHQLRWCDGRVWNTWAMVRRHSTARKQEVRNRKTKGSRMVALAEEDASSLLLAPAVGRERNANIEEGGNSTKEINVRSLHTFWECSSYSLRRERYKIGGPWNSFHAFTCHPCVGAMLISASFQF